ncbi:hypothetical protein [Pseudoroseicyclus sp. CXY001]|uniref:hypothetical protein n=1 Tax=Pseudoroseicyclus sp. CXY001 TaxID=3242492 RepID=UPI00357125AD
MALWHRFTLVLAALAFSAASAMAAGQMAPDEPLPDSLAFYVAAGGDLADLCAGGPGGHGSGHAGHCPICHGLPEAPALAFDPAAERLALPWQAPALADFGLAPLAPALPPGARAPPSTA